ncbi:Glycoside hydrolase family GHnc [Burkholderia sp. 8Y]|uniref:hypothetical protein n=1 Tax=Burkholderia sp. 8Y TaxID=2653133 RepID=UPI0012F02B94|nr:hypothetical protein [Burkholderia sp. 8Y]VXB25899.1 Glycoside hydrolase family GHnc [Burkholderia sp. 8Y]
MKGIAASFLGTLVVACSGCGGSGGSSNAASQPSQTSAQQNGSQIYAVSPTAYKDGRPNASYRLPIADYGVILPHGTAPDGSDKEGARDPFVFADNGTYYLHYDGSSGTGPWNVVEATSKDLLSWTVKGNIIPLGVPGELDVDCVCYGVTMFDGKQYQMYYTASTTQTPAPSIVPLAPYTTMKAHASTLAGPWVKDGAPFSPQAGTYYADTASPGQIVKNGNEYLQFFAAAQRVDGKLLRTIGVARAPTMAGPWTVDPKPVLPQAEQLENASLYFQQSSGQWFMFVNHVGLSPDGTREFSDAAWVYWTKDLNLWKASDKAVVIDGQSSKWAKAVIGLPTVIEKDGKLAVIYDGSATATNMPSIDDNLRRDLALSWINLPIKTPDNQ